MSKETNHSFQIKDVEKYGSIEKALIVKEIRQMALYRIRHNRSPWVYYSVRALSKKFPYMKFQSIHRWLKQMEKEGFIKTRIKNKHKYDHTVSYLLTELEDTSYQNETGEEWQKEDPSKNDTNSSQNETTIPSLSDSLSENSSNEEFATPSVADDYEKEINSLLAIFYKSINPAINFGNKTNREAAKWFIKQYGVDRATEIARYATSIFGQDYAPVITTPYQMKQKFSQLVNYKKRNDEEGGVIAE